jgi:hypothetical protein
MARISRLFVDSSLSNQTASKENFSLLGGGFISRQLLTGAKGFFGIPGSSLDLVDAGFRERRFGLEPSGGLIANRVAALPSDTLRRTQTSPP